MLPRLCLPLLAAAAAAFCQSNFGSIEGRVTDPTGAGVPNAAVAITETGTNIRVLAKTSQDGHYVAPALRPVLFRVLVEAAGFQRAVVDSVKVDTSKSTTVDVVLKVGSVEESVTVSGEAPLLQTVTGALTQTVDQRTINELPLNGRNTLELALTLPGATGSAGTEFSEFTTNEPLPGRELSINGGRAGSTQFQADGANVTSVALARMSISFSPDTIQEFSVQQSNYSAQYSQAGGAIIQQTTRSGSNEAHGTLFWFHRQKAFTANPFHAQRTAVTNFDARPPLRRQQLGAVVTGPVVVPKLYDGRNRTFFMASFEPARQLASNPGGPSYVRTPTEDEINGDFSKSLVYFRNRDGSVRTEPFALLYNHFDRRPDGTLALRPNPAFDPRAAPSATNLRYQYRDFPLFNPNDPDPARRGRVLRDAAGRSYVNPVSQNIVRALYPRPNILDPAVVTGLLGSNYTYFRQTRYTDNRYTVKIDHTLTDANRLMFRWTEQPQYGNRFQRDPVGYGLISDANTARQVMAAWTATPRASMVNELRANYGFGNFGRNFPEELLNRDLTSEFLNTGGPGQGAVNLLGYGGGRFFPGDAPYGVSGQAGGTGSQGRFDGLGFSQPQDVGKNTEHMYRLTDDFSWVRGNQTLKFGLAASHLQLNQSNLGAGSLAGGRFTFDRDRLAEADCNTAPLAGTIPGCPAQRFGGDPFAAFMLGMPTTVQVQTENLSVPYYYRWFDLGAYVQDDWRVKPSLTLNLGLRYQYQSPRWEKFNRQGLLNMDRIELNPFVTDARGNPLPAPVFEYAGAGGRSRYVSNPQKDVFEPRFGFAWTPSLPWLSRKLVVRGGYGISHATMMGNDREPIPNLGSQTAVNHRRISYVLGSNDVNAPGNIPTCGLARCNERDVPMQFGFNNPVLASDPTLFQVPPSGVIRPSDSGNPRSDDPRPRPNVLYQSTGVVRNKDFRMPTIQSYNLTVQYEVMASAVASVGYLGSRGTHLFGPSFDINRVDPFTGAVPYPGYAGRASNGIFVLDPTNSASTYHALTAEVERRMAQGLQFKVNYTFSKNLDDSSGGIRFPIPNNSFNNSSMDVPVLRNQNPYDSRSERAVASTHTPHVFNIAGLWELPLGKGRRWLNRGGLLNHLAGDWRLNGLSRVRAGFPITVPLGIGNSLNVGTPGGSQRPDVIAGVPLINPDWSRDRAQFTSYVNPRAFAVPEPGRYGNAPRNFNVAAPWVKQFDLSVFKQIRPFENRRRYFELRAEFFNVLNYKNLIPNPNIAGLLTGANQNPLLVGTAPNQTPVPGVQNRFANLRAPGVWDAIIRKSEGAPVDEAIAALPGPGAGGVGCPANAAELAQQTAALSPACVARSLSLNSGFGRLNAGSYQLPPRTVQFALKFYF